MGASQHRKKFDFLFPATFLYGVILKGNKVRCNICGHNFRRFLRDSTTKRENARCPRCSSIEAGRVLWFYLTNEVLGKKNKKRFLYFSPDRLIFEKLKKYNIEIDTESSNYFEKLSDKSFKKNQGGKYDVIIFAHLLQTVKDEQTTFIELLRLLRTGGFVLLMTVVNWEMDRTYEKPVTDEDKERLKSFYSPGLERVYGADVAKRLTKAGFDVETIDYSYQLGIAARDYYRLGEGIREIIFKCKKI
jgi:DNA-directed RNA polymerase subunit RPC12/RpoP